MCKILMKENRIPLNTVVLCDGSSRVITYITVMCMFRYEVYNNDNGLALLNFVTVILSGYMISK